MLVETMYDPGLVTLVFPFAIFGYALLEESRPKKQFWYFIMAYTQTLVIIEFLLSLSFWQAAKPEFYESLR